MTYIQKIRRNINLVTRKGWMDFFKAWLIIVANMLIVYLVMDYFIG